MPIARPEPQDARVIAHVDMDCFYAQVEQRKQPELRGLPTAVVQYNSWKGGALIAVSYEARKFGVKRSMRGDEAKKVCPNIQLVQVPVARGKADLNLYRNAGSEVVSILATKGRCERASIDEVYLDLTDAAESMLLETPPWLLEEFDELVLQSHVLGVTSDDCNRAEVVRGWLCQSTADHKDKLLACGAIIVARLRTKVLEETQFTCSAGIAHNKMLAKLASPMHKPAQQTIVPFSSVKDLLASLPVKKMKQLGGKLGSSLQIDLGVNTVGDLLRFSEEKLQEHYGINTGSWLWNIARGISGEEVEGRILPKSHGCGKTFPGPRALRTIAAVEHWLNQLSEELSERLQSDFDHNRRVAHTLTLHARAFKANDLDSQKKFPSKSCPLRYGTVKIHEDARRLFDSALQDFLDSQNIGWGVTSLSIAASKIFDTPAGTSSILKFFQGKNSTTTSSSGSADFIQDDPLSPSGSKSCTLEDQVEQEWWFDGDDESHHQDGKLQRCVLNDETDHQNGTLQRSVLDDETPHQNGTLQISVLDEMLPHDGTLQRSMLDCKATGDDDDTSSQGRPLKGTNKSNRKGKDKGTYSILRFFAGNNSSSSTQQTTDGLMIQDHAPLIPGSESHLQLNQTEGCKIEPNSNSNGIPHQEKTGQSSAWALRIEDIDPSVIDELPLEIQREFQGWFRQSKRANKAKGGPSITHYFSTAKNSEGG